MSESMRAMKKPARRFDRAGYSIPAFAEVLGLSPEQVRAAIKAKQIATVLFAGALRIPKTEAPRVAELLGLELREPTPAARRGRPPTERRINDEWDMLR